MKCGRCICHIVVTVFAICTRLSTASDRDFMGDALDRITIPDLKRHCGTLASDSLEGREAGTTGGYAAAAYVQTELKKIEGIVPPTPKGWLQDFGAGFRNIIAVLPGSDPELRHEIILIGAHYDHVGRGNQYNSQGPIGYIHNGADDNASGTASLLELIDAFASLTPAPRRTLVFAFWDAEEKGLLGSLHWISQPTHPLKNVKFVLNTDMLGRLRDGKLTVVGWRSAPGLRSRLVRLNPLGDLDYHYEPSVIADSDHHPFYSAKIPTLHIDSGKHDDYHRPSDDADKLNYRGLHRLAELAFQLVFEVANDRELPKFRNEALTETAPAWLSEQAQADPHPRLGVAFDKTQFEANRAVVVTVTPDSAAFKGGIRPGDRLLKLAHWNSGSVADLRTIVQVAQNPVVVQLERPGVQAPIDLQVELTGPPVRIGITWQSDSAIPGCVIIERVIEASPADRAGLKVGDVLMEISRKPIGSDVEIRRRLQMEPSPIQCRIERRGKVKDLTVELFEAPPRNTSDP